jgi:hypothetical protein
VVSPKYGGKYVRRVFFIAPDFSLGIPRLKPRVINFSPKYGGKYVRRVFFIAPDFSLGIPRLKPRVIVFIR